jgi:hypothetical protein
VKCLIDGKREAERPVCDPCRRGLADDLRALVDAYAMLVVGEVLDGANDPVSQTLPAGTVRSGSRGAPVTGSREAPVPVNLDVVDLTLAAGPGTIYDPLGDLAAMQVGLIPVATVLDQWVRDWRDIRDRGEHLPVPTVVTLAGWLYDRLDWACDEHHAVDEFAAEIRAVVRACNRAIGNTPARPEVLVGVPCATPECDGLLVHDTGSKYRVECGSCGRLWTDEEYIEWTRIVVANPVHTQAFLDATNAWLDRRSARRAA